MGACRAYGIKAGLIGLLIIFVSGHSFGDNIYYPDRCKKVASKVSEKNSSSSRVKILSWTAAALVSALGVSMWRTDRLPDFSFMNFNSSSRMIHSDNAYSMNQNSETQKSKTNHEGPKKNANGLYNPDEIEIRKDRLEIFEDIQNAKRQESKWAREEVDWKLIMTSPFLRSDSESSYGKSSTEQFTWKFKLSMDQKIRSLPQILDLLQQLEKPSIEVKTPEQKYDFQQDIAGYRGMFGHIIETLPYPEELSAEARSNYDHYDLEIQNALRVYETTKDPIIMETLSRLWSDQFYYAGTISLPSYFQRDFENKSAEKLDSDESIRFRKIKFNHPNLQSEAIISDHNDPKQFKYFYEGTDRLPIDRTSNTLWPYLEYDRSFGRPK
ncbi:MAG: hypothetical protein J0L93_03760 [Deltaproteobacteria bacterium]|nr:hypothetical protein [Deltaproteobacteria bacterium]